MPKDEAESIDTRDVAQLMDALAQTAKLHEIVVNERWVDEGLGEGA